MRNLKVLFLFILIDATSSRELFASGIEIVDHQETLNQEAEKYKTMFLKSTGNEYQISNSNSFDEYKDFSKKFEKVISTENSTK
jgi:hypothetical protein